MKQNPKDIPVVESLRAGILTRDGFMGEDTRPFTQIIMDDAALLASAGFTLQEITDKMAELTKAGLTATGAPVDYQGFIITVEEYMGKLSCPFRDHRAPKRNTEVINQHGQRMSWTDLSIHLIKAHGFFQGKGSPYRLEPDELAAFLFTE
ncbi:MAG: hypothetical protein GXZ04_00455 [Clostridiales bacterium]|nr:hypothetical protein [Clostridiales bacterium]